MKKHFASLFVGLFVLFCNSVHAVDSSHPAALNYRDVETKENEAYVSKSFGVFTDVQYDDAWSALIAELGKNPANKIRVQNKKSGWIEVEPGDNRSTLTFRFTQMKEKSDAGQSQLRMDILFRRFSETKKAAIIEAFARLMDVVRDAKGSPAVSGDEPVLSGNTKKQRKNQGKAGDNKEGYKNIPWGAYYSVFKSVKSVNEDLGAPSNIIIRHNMFYNILPVIFDAPVETHNVFGRQQQEIDTNSIPSKFASVYVKNDDVNFVFFDNRFAIGYSEIIEENYDEYYNTLAKKYEVLKKWTFNVPSPEKDPDVVTAAMFSKSNTLVFLIRTQRTVTYMGASKPSACLIYMSKEFHKTITTEISAWKKNKAKADAAVSKKDSSKIE